MTRYQACVGPGRNRVHIVKITDNVPSVLTMCERTTVVQAYRGQLSVKKFLCPMCEKKLKDEFDIEKVTSKLIGVREII